MTRDVILRGPVRMVSTLCRTVNIENFSEAVWRVMRLVFEGSLGQNALSTLCVILEDIPGADIGMQRGAVFFMGREPLSPAGDARDIFQGKMCHSCQAFGCIVDLAV